MGIPETSSISDMSEIIVFRIILVGLQYSLLSDPHVATIHEPKTPRMQVKFITAVSAR
jgi:hypothetical protein